MVRYPINDKITKNEYDSRSIIVKKVTVFISCRPSNDLISEVVKASRIELSENRTIDKAVNCKYEPIIKMLSNETELQNARAERVSSKKTFSSF